MKDVLFISEMALPPRTGMPSSKFPFSDTASTVFVDEMVNLPTSSPVLIHSVGKDFPDSYTLSDLVPSHLQHGRSEDVAKCFVESAVNSPNASVKAMCKIPKQHPHPFHGNYSILLDVTVTKFGLGILVLEVVQSGNDYIETFAKTVVDCIEMLRTWRCHNDSVDECYGFVLPNLSETSCALEVRVKFQPFRFFYWMDYVGKNEVQDRIKSIVSQWQFECNEPHPYYFFIRLRQEECNLVENGAIQVYSQSSIVLKSPSFFWKYNRHTSRVYLINVGLALRVEQRLYQYALYPFSSKRVSLTKFLQFHALQDPLSRTEAKPCLLPLLDGLHCALTELYQNNIAHLDIHLPNICFGSGCTVCTHL